MMSIVVHHQPHFTTQKPNETVLWGYFLYPRRYGEFVNKPYIKMTGKEMALELIGQLAKVDPGPGNIRDRQDEIMASIINNIPVYMPYASAPSTIAPKLIDRKSFPPTQPTSLSPVNLPSSHSRWSSPNKARSVQAKLRLITSPASR